MGLGHLPKPFLGGLCLANQVVMKHTIIELKIKIKVHAIIDNTTQHNITKKPISKIPTP
jgi:hypothetical protein